MCYLDGQMNEILPPNLLSSVTSAASMLYKKEPIKQIHFNPSDIDNSIMNLYFTG